MCVQGRVCLQGKSVQGMCTKGVCVMCACKGSV